MLQTCLRRLSADLPFGTALSVLVVSSSSAQGIDDSWTAELATTDEIAAYYSDGDELDNAARQYVAYETIHYAIEEAVGARVYSGDMTAGERAALDTFREAKNDADMAMYSKYRKADNAKYLDFQQRRFDFRDNESNLIDILERFAPPLLDVMAPKIVQEASKRRALASRKLDRIVQEALQISFVAFLVLIFLYLLIGSWRDKRVALGVEVENKEDSITITYKPGKHGPVAALSVYPLYINIVLFMATLSVGLIFMFVAAERSEWFQNFLNLRMPPFLEIMFYKAFWVGLGLFILFAPWWFLAIANFRRRKPLALTISREGITAGRKFYDMALIRDYYVWGYGDGSPTGDSGGTHTVGGGGNAASRAAESGAMHGAAIQDSANLFKRTVGRVGNEVMIDYGEHQRAVAKWLPWKRALIVYEEIDKAMNRLAGFEHGVPTSVAVD